MNKVKIMLSAITVMAVVGGTLAFKAKDANFCYYTKAAGATICPSVRTIDTFTDNGVGLATAKAAPTNGSPCPATVATVDCTRLLATTID